MSVTIFCGATDRSPDVKWCSNELSPQSSELKISQARNEIVARHLGKFATMKMEVTRSSETSAHFRTTRRYIPEDGTIQNATSTYTLTEGNICL
jgi:hypothetical protein